MTLLQSAIAEIGVIEYFGANSNPQIIKYAREAGFPEYTSDETSWCSLFINWLAFKCGMERSESLAARSWLNIGVFISNPEPGDIVVFWRESRNSWKGHVGVFIGYSKESDRVYCLGGNQGNQVSITAYAANQLLGFRRLKPINKILIPDRNLRLGDTGSEVVILQDALKQLSYSLGTSDGIFGPKTEQALKDFQSTDSFLEINGVLDKKSRDKLVSILTIKTEG